MACSFGARDAALSRRRNTVVASDYLATFLAVELPTILVEPAKSQVERNDVIGES
jgi:hypothetical protein